MLATRHFTKREVEAIASGDFDGDVVQVGVTDEQVDDRRNAIRMSAIVKTRDDGLFYEILYEEGWMRNSGSRTRCRSSRLSACAWIGGSNPCTTATTTMSL